MVGARPLGAGWGHGDATVSLALAAPEQEADGKPEPFFHQHEKLPQVQCSEEVEGEGGPGPWVGGHTLSSGVPREPRLRSIPGLAVSQGFTWGGHSAAGGGGGAEKGVTPPRTPALLPPQLSYNMVSACNRLCRTRLLCGLRKEDEELVSGQESPRSPASALAGTEDIWGGPAPQMEVGGAVQCGVSPPGVPSPLGGGGVSSSLGASSLLGGFLSPGGVPFPRGVLSLPSSPPVPPAPLRE